jgi:hypothetical protein
MKKLAKLTFLILFTQVAQAQSPWTREKGKAYVQLGFSGIFFNEFAGENGKAEKLGADFSDVTLQLYSEYGITSKLEAQLVLPFKSLSSSGELLGTKISNSFSGLGNISLGLKYKIMDSNWKLSSGLLLSPKTSQYDDKTSFSTGFNATGVLPYVTVGSSSGKWYYYGNVGYGYMTNDYSDYFRFNAEVGYNVIPKGHIMIAIDTRNIVSKEDAFLKDNKQSLTYIDRQTYNAFGLKMNYEFVQDKFGANFSVFGAAGNEYTPLAPSINFGAYVKL